eukprot:11899234-Alexandrium_andersonii.AAC.1
MTRGGPGELMGTEAAQGRASEDARRGRQQQGRARGSEWGRGAQAHWWDRIRLAGRSSGEAGVEAGKSRPAVQGSQCLGTQVGPRRIATCQSRPLNAQ